MALFLEIFWPFQGLRIVFRDHTVLSRTQVILLIYSRQNIKLSTWICLFQWREETDYSQQTFLNANDFIGKDYWERIDILTDVIYELFIPIEAIAMTQEEWEKGDTFVTDFARDGQVLFAA